jgi:L-histidine Nalpha-methyltransferase
VQSDNPDGLTTKPERAFAEAVVAGLSQPRKTIPARYFYDLAGSALFEEITEQPEYYQTRTEIALLEQHAETLGDLVGRGRPVVEFGAGSAAKTPLLLDATQSPTYVPIDISGAFLEAAMADLAKARPDLRILPITADFIRPVALPALTGPLTGFFPGSTIGNLAHGAAVDLLRSFRQTLGDEARLVIGIDTRKDRYVLEAAYDDVAGVTAAFNLNLLHRINRELEGTIPVDAFKHRAVWDKKLGRIEMHLVANRDISFRAAGSHFSMQSGESIHTENSYKYTLEEARFLARAAHWEPLAFWTDAEGLFGLHVWSAADDALQP